MRSDESVETVGETTPEGGSERGSPSVDGVSGSANGESLSASDLVVSYPSEDDPVLEGEGFTASKGEVTSLVGPNGSGKSTLLKTLADQLSRDGGTVLLQGREIEELDTKEVARRLGMLSQEATSPDSITVEDLAFHGRYPHRGFFEGVSREDVEAVERALELAGCEHLRDRELGSLSGGQRQLAWIAMVLAQDTDVLLLDEPTTFLDLHHQMEVVEVIERLRDERDVTVVVVLHDVQQAARLADRMVVMKDGEVRATGTPGDVVREGLIAEVFEVDAEVEFTERGPRIEPLCARNDVDEEGSDAG